MIGNGKVAQIEMNSTEADVTLTDGTKFTVSTPGYAMLYASMQEEIDKQIAAGTLKIDTPEPATLPWWVSMLPSLGLIIIISMVLPR